MRAIEALARAAIVSPALLATSLLACGPRPSQPSEAATAVSAAEATAQDGAAEAAPAVAAAPAGSVAEQLEAFHDRMWGTARVHRPPTYMGRHSFVARPWGEVADPYNSRPVLLRGPKTKKASPGSWPATLVLSDGSKTCTSAAVGPRVVLTAAHCLTTQLPATPDSPASYLGKMQIGNEPERELACERHVSFAADPTADFALCLAATDLGLPLYENVDDTGAALSVGAPVRLQGFGCTDDDLFNAYLYEGEATIQVKPPPPFHTTTQGDFVCPGDSGGGAFIGQTLALFGVNSRVEGFGVSKLATTSVQPFLNWARGWAERNHVKICGLDEQVTGCRTGTS